GKAAHARRDHRHQLATGRRHTDRSPPALEYVQCWPERASLAHRPLGRMMGVMTSVRLGRPPCRARVSCWRLTIAWSGRHSRNCSKRVAKSSGASPMVAPYSHLPPKYDLTSSSLTLPCHCSTG